MFEPDPVQMRRHVGHLFEGWLDGCQEGRIELAWTDGRDGKLKHAVSFGTDELDELVERAYAENCRQGQNVYIGQALRHPDIAPFGRGKDDEFFALTAYYVDIDDDVIATASISYRTRGCPPTGVVITGREPHLRAQLFWRLDEPVRDPDRCRQQNAALAYALQGDPSVVNPSRVLRLGGSIAWPMKEGRVIERTEFLDFNDGRPKVYLPEQIERAFPPSQMPTPGAQQPATTTATASSSLQIGTTSLTVEDCMARIRAGDHWHDNMLRLVGHWVARGWSDTEILTAAEAMTLPGYAVADTRRDVSRMIHGGRTKWATPAPSNAMDPQAQVPFTMQPVGLLQPSQRPPRDWLVRHRLMRKHTTLTAAAPGIGKSTLAIEEAVSLASGMDFLGFGIEQPHKVAIINNEETRDELERRIEATCVRFGVPFEAIAQTLYLHSGVDAEKFIVARRGADDSVVATPRAHQLGQFLREAEIDLLVVDPFVQIHTASENQNEEIEQVMMALRAICVHANCALHLVHHTRKPQAGTSYQAGDIHAVRGGGAIVGDAHFVFTLADMAPGDAEQLGISDDDRKKFVRLDDAKGKLAPPSGALWFEREGVTMPYGLMGEEVGVLVPFVFEDELDPATSLQVTEILTEIDRRWRDGNPFSAAVQSPRYVVHMMTQNHGCSPKFARALLRRWMVNAVLASEVFDTHRKSRGLKVLSWPG